MIRAFGVILIVQVMQFASCEKLKGLNYLSVGYDVYLSNPLAEGPSLDPGFKTKPIFDFTYKDKLKSSDGHWEIPDYTTVIRNDDCSLKFNSRIATGVQNYSMILNAYVDSTYKDLHGRFKGSYDYKQVQKNTINNGDIYTTSSADCSVYLAFIRTAPWPSVTTEFKNSLKELPILYDREVYMKFLQTYGTHYAYMMYLGARFSCVNRLTKDSWPNFVWRGYNTQSTISGACYAATGALDKNISYDKDAVDGFNSECTQRSKSIVGEEPVRGGDTAKWFDKTKENPMPIHYKLKRISTILDMDILKNINNIEMIQNNLELALEDYCAYLKKKYAITNCTIAPPDPPLPTLRRSCRLCSSACAGAFPDSSAAFRNYGDPISYFSYNDKCEAPFNRYTIPGYTYMCCQPDVEYSIGSCRVCTKCGKDYSENMGNLHYTEKNVKPSIFSYDDNCEGNLLDRGLDSKPSLCCKKPATCSFCLSCGGDYPYEEGVYYKKLPLFYEGRGDKCGKHYSGKPESVTLCCAVPGKE